MKSDIAKIICPDNFIPAFFKNVADGIAKDHIPQMTDMKSLVRIRL